MWYYIIFYMITTTELYFGRTRLNLRLEYSSPSWNIEQGTLIVNLMYKGLEYRCSQNIY